MSDTYAADLFAAELGGDAPTIDLHEALDTLDGEKMLEPWLHRQFMQGERVVCIVHGRGSGKMQEMVRRVLHRSSIVEYAADAQNPGSVGGAMYAILVKK